MSGDSSTVPDVTPDNVEKLTAVYIIYSLNAHTWKCSVGCGTVIAILQHKKGHLKIISHTIKVLSNILHLFFTVLTHKSTIISDENQKLEQARFRRYSAIYHLYTHNNSGNLEIHNMRTIIITLKICEV